jgi:Na+/melibiose symporter-like transporter
MTLERTVPLWRKAAFGAGSIADSIYFYAWDLFVLFYYTQVLGLPGSLTGLAILVSLVVDAVSDPYVGYLSDKWRGLRWGRRNTLIIATALPLAMAFILLFTPPEGLGHTGLFTWLLAFGVLSRILLTFFAIPYKAISADLSRSVIERPRIVAAAAIGNTLARIGVPLVTFGFFFGESTRYERGQLDPANYAPFAIAAALVMVACMALVVLGTYRPLMDDERAEAHAAPQSLAPLAAFREVARALTMTPNVRRVFVLAIFVFVCLVSITVLKIHVLTYVWQVPKGSGKWVMSMQGFGGGLGALLLPLLLREFDRRKALVWGIGGFTLLNAVAVLLPVFGVGPPPGSPQLANLVAGMLFASGIFLGMYLVAVGSIGSDVADEHEANTGTRQQALVGGFMTLAIKTAGGLMSFVTGVYLDLIAFPAGVPLGEVAPEAINKLAWFVAVFCAVGAAGVAFVSGRLDVSLVRQRDINRRLAAQFESR